MQTEEIKAQIFKCVILSTFLDKPCEVGKVEL